MKMESRILTEDGGIHCLAQELPVIHPGDTFTITQTITMTNGGVIWTKPKVTPPAISSEEAIVGLIEIVEDLS